MFISLIFPDCWWCTVFICLCTIPWVVTRTHIQGLFNCVVWCLDLLFSAKKRQIFKSLVTAWLYYFLHKGLNAFTKIFLVQNTNVAVCSASPKIPQSLQDWASDLPPSDKEFLAFLVPMISRPIPDYGRARSLPSTELPLRSHAQNLGWFGSPSIQSAIRSMQSFSPFLPLSNRCPERWSQCPVFRTV